MDLLGDLSTTEREEIAKFLGTHNSVLPDGSLPPLTQLTQLSQLTHLSELPHGVCDGHCSRISDILHKMQTKLMSAVYPPLHPHLLALKDWPWSDQFKEVVREAGLGKKSKFLNEVK